MEYIQLLLAQLFDKFKAGNPKVAAAILFILGLILYATENGLAELIGVDLTEAVKWITIILGFLQGSRTTAILSENK